MLEKYKYLYSILEDGMDMMVGWYPSRNIDFENEVKKI